MRVVSLVPSHTETLHALGAWESVVGVTSFCVHPEAARREKAVVGGTKTPKVDRIVELDPDLVVVAVEENPREHVEALRDAGLEVLVTDVRSLRDARDAVLQLGDALDRGEEAEALAQAMQDARDEVLAVTAERDPITVLVPIWRDPWMGFNRDTFAHDVLETAGGRNVLGSEDDRYPAFELSDVPSLGAEGALLPSEPYRFTDDHRDLLAKVGLPRRHVHLLDGEALTWYGARTPWGLREVLRSVEGLREALGGA